MICTSQALREAEFEEFEEALVQSLNNFRNQISNAKKTSAAKRQKLADPEEAGAENAGDICHGEMCRSHASRTSK